jgi:hypothetical protein
MARPQRPLDPDAGPIQAFAAELRRLHAAAGSPKFTTMHRRTGRSRTALSEAVGGDHLPNWETLEAFVRGCDAKPLEWRGRWQATYDLMHPRAPEEDPGEVSANATDNALAGTWRAAEVPTAPTSGAGRWKRPRLRLIIIAPAVVATVVSSVVTAVARGGMQSGSREQSAVPHR